jgi:hypothetical protein
MQFYVNAAKWTDEYISRIEAIWGEKPVFVGKIVGKEKFSRKTITYVEYTLSHEPQTTDQRWIAGSTQEAMLQGGLIEAEPVVQPLPVVVVFKSSPEGWAPRWDAKVLIAGQRDDIRLDGFKSEGEVWQAINERYPLHEKVATHEEYIERRRQNLAVLGSDFELESLWWR